MKNRSLLIIFELTVMLAVFAFTAAISLRGFAKAELISRESLRLDNAVMLAQSAAEIFRSENGTAELALGLTRAEAERLGLELVIFPIKTDSELYRAAEIAVLFDGGEIYRLKASAGEVGDYE